MGSAANLLFTISGDASPGTAELDAFRTSVAANMGAVRAEFGATAAAAKVAAVQTGGSTRGAREAMRGLGEEMGVRMPRFVSGWLASLGPVAGIMSAAFAPIAVIGLVEILGKIPGALQKGIDWLHGWTEESKKAFAESVKTAIAAESSILEYNAKLRAIALIGKDGLEKFNLEMVIQSQNFDAVNDKLVEYLKRRQQLKDIVEWKPPALSPGAELGAMSLTGARTNTPAGPSHEDIEKAKTELAALKPAIDALEKQVGELHLKDLETSAESRVASAAASAKRATEDAKATADLARQLLAQKEQTLDIRREEWNAQVDGTRDELAKEGQLSVAHLAQLAELRQAGLEKITRVEAAAMAKRGEELAKLAQKNSNRWLTDLVKEGAERVKIDEELQAHLIKDEAATVEGRKAALNSRIDIMREGFAERVKLNDWEEAQIAALRAAGAAKIDREAEAAGQTELAQLERQRQQIERTHETSQERIEGQYATDVAEFDAAEKKKLLTLAQDEAGSTATVAAYAAIRAALLIKEQSDLQTLHNSQGWQGIFGAEFAATIKRDEELSKEWADSQQRSHLAVRMSLESLKEMAQDTFGAMAQGEASAIMGAIVYGKNVKQAMEEAAKGVLASLAAQAAVKAIFALAEAAVMAATGDEAGAAQELEAAALYGSGAAASAIAGRAIPSGQGGGAGAAGGGGGYRSSSGAGASTGSGSGADMGTAANMGGKHVTVNVYGHIYGTSGVAEFAGLLNDAVLNGDVPLTATNTKTGVQVIR